MAKSYLDLGVYQESFDLFIDTHEFTLSLPKYELYEQGSQLRRSAYTAIHGHKNRSSAEAGGTT